MSKTTDLPATPEASNTAVPVIGAPEKMCVEFVQFCKEQYLQACAAQTFFHVLHNHKWETERDQIRDSLRAEVEALFAPAERALAEGKDCREPLMSIIREVRIRTTH